MIPTLFDLASFAASIAALAVAAVAICLSVVFYRMSTQLSESTREAAQSIGAGVDKLEKLFDRLYADTFSVMKDTVADMRKHAWGRPLDGSPDVQDAAEKKAEEKVNALRVNIDKQLATILEGQQLADGRVNELRGLMNRAIEASRTVEHEAREETIRNYILNFLAVVPSPVRRPPTIDEIVIAAENADLPFAGVLEELRAMRKEGVISWSTRGVQPETLITLTDDKETPAKDK